jgi:hypothetical protein
MFRNLKSVEREPRGLLGCGLHNNNYIVISSFYMALSLSLVCVFVCDAGLPWRDLRRVLYITWTRVRANKSLIDNAVSLPTGRQH